MIKNIRNHSFVCKS